VEGSPKFGSEECISVRDEVDHQTILTIPFVKEYHSDLGGCVGGVGACDACVGAKRVGHGEDSVLSILLRKWADEVQGDSVKVVVWYRQWVKGACGLGGVVFVMLTLDARWYVCIFQVALHVGPVVGPVEGLVALVKAKVPQGVMCQVVQEFTDL
jgi:hypothetical protein